MYGLLLHGNVLHADMSGNIEKLDIVRGIIVGILFQRNVHHAEMNVLLFKS
jgi:hypothetical protein